MIYIRAVARGALGGKMSHSLSAHLDSRYIGSGLMYILAYKLIKSMMTSIDFYAFADLELHYSWL